MTVILLPKQEAAALEETRAEIKAMKTQLARVNEDAWAIRQALRQIDVGLLQ